MGVKRPDLVLAGAVLLCLPMVPGILQGNVSPTTAILRLTGAIIICWVAGAILSRVLTRYGEESRRAEITRMLEQAQAARAAAERPESAPPAEPRR